VTVYCEVEVPVEPFVDPERSLSVANNVNGRDPTTCNLDLSTQQDVSRSQQGQSHGSNNNINSDRVTSSADEVTSSSDQPENTKFTAESARGKLLRNFCD